MASGAADVEGSDDRRSCCKRVRRMMPQHYREELCNILKMTGPLVASQMLTFMLPFVVTLFCGRLGNEVLAGFGIASATINLTTAAIGLGLSMGSNTLISQTFGGKNLLRVGVILQRGILILMLFCLPCWALLMNAQPILLCLGQDPEVTRIAQLYITAFIPAVPLLFLHCLMECYLQNQGIILPQMYCAALANIANVVTNYVLIHLLDFGVNGSAVSFGLSYSYICIFLFAYIRWKKLHVPTWGGWSIESLKEWGSFMRLAVPSALMTCFEWWIHEFGGFFAGILGGDELAAQHVVIMIAYIFYMVPLGLEFAGCARVGNALGAGDTAGALFTTKMVFVITGIFAFIQGIVLACVKNVIGFIFTSDEKIVAVVSHLINVYVFLQFFDAIVAASAGIFMAMGKQKIPAVANLIGYYGVGLSMAITFMFVIKLGIVGFWLGLLIADILQSIIYVIIILNLNWKTLTEEATKRAQKKTHLKLLSTTDLSDDNPGDNTSGQTGANSSSRGDYMPASTKCHDGNEQTQGEHEVQKQRGGQLSTKQLIVRRGLTLFVALALLAVGMCVHFLVPLPEPLPSMNNTFLYNNTLDQINTTYTTD